VIAFEGTVLIGSIFNLIGMIIHARLFRLTPRPEYDRRFSRDKFGLLVGCREGELARLKALLAESVPEELHVRQ
jgi:hypothetical protein